MLVKLKHVKEAGFEGATIWSSNFHWLYKKELTGKKTFLIINNHFPQNIEIFRLTDVQFKKYKKNKLSLVPSGCCGVSDCEHVTGNVFWSGEFKSGKHVKEVISAAEKLIYV